MFEPLVELLHAGIVSETQPGPSADPGDSPGAGNDEKRMLRNKKAYVRLREHGFGSAPVSS
jgi:hypothetical protein